MSPVSHNDPDNLKKLQNIVGSLRGDIRKLKNARLVLEAKNTKLKDEIKQQKTLSKKVFEENKAIKNSTSWKIRQLIISAFTRPGMNTLLLPYAMTKAIFAHRNKEKIQSRTKASQKSAKNISISNLLAAKNSAPKKIYKLLKPGRMLSLDNLKELKVACILDEFTYNCFDPECSLLQLTPDKWQDELESFAPDLLFVEAAWLGKNDLWLRKIKKCSDEIISIAEYCHKQHIPTVFWGKEDPSDFDKFLTTACLFDFIGTTDIDCVDKYRQAAQHATVILFPFAAQPRIHNPTERYNRHNRFCFAGAFYNHFAERKDDLERLFDILSERGGVDIYDRNFHIDRNLFIFPEKYKASILGSLRSDQIEVAYKGYRYGINLNSIKESSSMFARRVFELIASNTIVVSNFSKGLKNFFGDLVISSDNPAEIKERIEQLLNDDTYFRKLRVAGLRKVYSEHLYQDRLRYLAKQVWEIDFSNVLPHILVVCEAQTEKELNLLLHAYTSQNYRNTSIVVVYSADSPVSLVKLDKKQICKPAEAKHKKVKDFIDEGFVACFHISDYYGANYLYDLALTTRYKDTNVIGKGAWYTGDGTILCNEGKRYSQVDALPKRSCMVNTEICAELTISELISDVENGNVDNLECYSIDEFNYCRESLPLGQEIANDIEGLDSGISLTEIMY